MTYHDNVVYFSCEEGYSIISGTYTINGYSVTSGQDPDNKIHDGLTVSCDSSGQFTFSVGRQKSTSVADWFNSQVLPPQCTFNHAADDLNFAFIGTLVLNLSGGVLGAGSHSFVFSNVALAQGNSGSSNNWWFGGKNCSYESGNTVIGNGVNSDGAAMFVRFTRGGSGNSVNQVSINI